MFVYKILCLGLYCECVVCVVCVVCVQVHRFMVVCIALNVGNAYWCYR